LNATNSSGSSNLLILVIPAAVGAALVIGGVSVHPELVQYVQEAQATFAESI